MKANHQPKTVVFVGAEGRVPVVDFCCEFSRCGVVARGVELTPDVQQEVKKYLTSNGVIAGDHPFFVLAINKVSNRENTYQAAVKFS